MSQQITDISDHRNLFGVGTQVTKGRHPFQVTVVVGEGTSIKRVKHNIQRNKYSQSPQTEICLSKSKSRPVDPLVSGDRGERQEGLPHRSPYYSIYVPNDTSNIMKVTTTAIVIIVVSIDRIGGSSGVVKLLVQLLLQHAMPQRIDDRSIVDRAQVPVLLRVPGNQLTDLLERMQLNGLLGLFGDLICFRFLAWVRVSVRNGVRSVTVSVC